jgi:hypothetical protein
VLQTAVAFAISQPEKAIKAVESARDWELRAIFDNGNFNHGFRGFAVKCGSWPRTTFGHLYTK